MGIGGMRVWVVFTRRRAEGGEWSRKGQVKEMCMCMKRHDKSLPFLKRFRDADLNARVTCDMLLDSTTMRSMLLRRPSAIQLHRTARHRHRPGLH